MMQGEGLADNKCGFVTRSLCAALGLAALSSAPLVAASTGTMNASTGWVTQVDPDVNGDGVIKVLALGHSFMSDAKFFVPEIFSQAAKAGGKPLMFVDTYYGDCSEDKYIGFIKDATGTKVAMSVQYTDGFPEDQKLKSVQPGDIKYWPMKDYFALCDDWDIVTINTFARGVPVDKTCQSYATLVREKIDAVNGTTPYKLGWYMTWAFSERSDHTYFESFDRDKGKMYDAIVAGVQKSVVESGLFDFVIPAGTAIQNFRTAHYKNICNADYTGVNDDLCRDGFHLDFSAGCWCCTLVWADSFGVDLSKIAYPYEREIVRGGTLIRVNAGQDNVARESAAHAVTTPKAVTVSAWKDRPWEAPCTAAAHSYGAATTVPKTCTADGYDTKTCATCGYEYRLNYVPAGHDFIDVVTPPTCTLGGYTTRTCATCKTVEKTAKIHALGHDYAVTESVPRTCTTDGHVTHVCQRTGCGYSYVETVPAGHEVATWSVAREPTYATEGEHQGTCSACHQTVTEPLPKKTDNVTWDWTYSTAADFEATQAHSVRYGYGYNGGRLIPVYDTMHEWNDEAGVYRILAGYDPMLTDKSAILNMEIQRGTRLVALTTPEGCCATTLRVRGGIGRPLFPYGAASVPNSLPGVVFAADDAAFYSFAMGIDTTGELRYGLSRFVRDREKRTLEMALNLESGAIKVVSVDGEPVTATAKLNELAAAGKTGGVEIGDDNFFQLEVAYEVGFDRSSGVTTIRPFVIWDRDGLKWTAELKTFAVSAANWHGKTFGTTLVDCTGYASAFGVVNMSGNPAQDIIDGNATGYNTTDVTSLYADYVKLCVHDWTEEGVAATCLRGALTRRTCRICGEVEEIGEGTPLGHAWGGWATVTPAGETADGLRKRSCSRCPAEETHVIRAGNWIGFDFGDAEFDGAALDAAFANARVIVVPPATGSAWVKPEKLFAKGSAVVSPRLAHFCLNDAFADVNGRFYDRGLYVCNLGTKAASSTALVVMPTAAAGRAPEAWTLRLGRRGGNGSHALLCYSETADTVSAVSFAWGFDATKANVELYSGRVRLRRAADGTWSILEREQHFKGTSTGKFTSGVENYYADAALVLTLALDPNGGWKYVIACYRDGDTSNTAADNVQTRERTGISALEGERPTLGFGVVLDSSVSANAMMAQFIGVEARCADAAEPTDGPTGEGVDGASVTGTVLTIPNVRADKSYRLTLEF